MTDKQVVWLLVAVCALFAIVLNLLRVFAAVR